MNRENFRILIVEDDQSFLTLLTKILQAEGYTVKGFLDPQEALKNIESYGPNLIISDLKMPKLDGVTLLSMVKEKNKDIDFILITAFATIETAVSAMKEGASDYLTKPFQDPDQLRLIVRKIFEKQKLIEENILLKSELLKEMPPVELIFAGMDEIFQDIKSVAPLDTTVILYGETGTGKTLIAKIIHHLSSRKGPFIEVNCAAIPETLLESELFGYEKGAFTGAISQKKGKFEIANEGTIFLDEISEMSLSLQAKLLKVVQEKTFERLGSLSTLRTNARIISATNRDLKELVQKKMFREDLYYRLNVFPIYIPPLRTRKSHIPEIAEYLVNRISARLGKTKCNISKKTLERLINYSWPGNIRELENVLERSIITSKSTEIDIPEYILIDNFSDLSLSDTFEISGNMKSIEKKAIVNALKKTSGNRRKAAEILGISLRALQYKIKEYNIKDL
ncbi:MAG: sigma-54 dependent transcriptional regulator [Thermodesulfovibrionales bacterium]|nr:sigma-54 dependent transcriptional regulator [Thermodesulfovibrionales bacterium]